MGVDVGKLLDPDGKAIKLPPSAKARCIECGGDYEFVAMGAWYIANALARAAGQEPLGNDEIGVCSMACHRARTAALFQREVARRRETDRLCDIARRGEPLFVPDEIIKYRPHDFARIQQAVEERREVDDDDPDR